MSHAAFRALDRNVGSGLLAGSAGGARPTCRDAARVGRARRIRFRNHRLARACLRNTVDLGSAVLSSRRRLAAGRIDALLSGPLSASQACVRAVVRFRANETTPVRHWVHSVKPKEIVT